MLQPTFGEAGPDSFFRDHHVKDPEALVAIIRACDARYRLDLNPLWLEQVRMYFQSVAGNGNAGDGWQARAGTAEHICNTYERNIMVDLYGVARLCFSTGFPGFRLARPGDLGRFWYEVAEPIRERMKHCNRYCGISHSVRRLPATLKPGDLVRRPS